MPVTDLQAGHDPLWLLRDGALSFYWEQVTHTSLLEPQVDDLGEANRRGLGRSACAQSDDLHEPRNGGHLILATRACQWRCASFAMVRQGSLSAETRCNASTSANTTTLWISISVMERPSTFHSNTDDCAKTTAVGISITWYVHNVSST